MTVFLAFCLFIVLPVAAGIGVLVMLWKDHQNHSRSALFKAIGRPRVQFVPAAAQKQGNRQRLSVGDAARFGGVVRTGRLCWTTGLTRAECQCSNCLRRRIGDG